MPNTRWWTFEDGRTNFGDVKPDTTDLAKLLLIEFGLVYANDWFLVPFTVPAGSIATFAGIAVTNVFGERIWVEAAGRGDDDDWQRWAMFLVSIKGEGHAAGRPQPAHPAGRAEGPRGPAARRGAARPRRDGQHGLGQSRGPIPLPSGEPKNGREAADRDARLSSSATSNAGSARRPCRRRLRRGAKIRYQVMSSVPENWIPMIPVHVDERQSRDPAAAGRDAAHPGGRPRPTPVPVRPRTSLLRHGLDAGPAERYFLHEEEVPRAGVRVTQAFQRTRWRDGRAWVWLGVRKQTGRGEGSSGLAFDRIIDVPPQD